MPTSVEAMYGKLRRVPVSLSEGFLEERTARLRELQSGSPVVAWPASLREFTPVIVDGKKLKQVAQWLLVARGQPGKLYGGKPPPPRPTRRSLPNDPSLNHNHVHSTGLALPATSSERSMPWRTAVVLVFVAIAAWTDLRDRKLYNWNTYSGMLIGFAMAALPGSPIALGDALAGWLACGSIMLLCFVLLPVGGGDVKLIAMLGACLGLEDGLNAMLWTCTLAAIAAVAAVIWQVGAWTLPLGTLRRVALLVRAKGWVPWTPEQRKILDQRFRFGPCALLAVILILSQK